jgi:hypothetical protein
MSATDRRPPYGTSASDNDFNALKFTCDSTSKVHEITKYNWSGKYVTIVADGDAFYAFTRNPSAAVDEAIAATDAGTNLQVGGLLVSKVKEDIRLPYFSQDGSPPKLYFVRASVGACNIYINLSDEPDRSA